MRILICASELPLEPVNGLRLQLRHVAGRLARRHEVVVLGYRSADQEGEPPPGVELVGLAPPARTGAAKARAWLRAGASGDPLAVARLTGPLATAARELLAHRPFDVVHVASSVLAGLAPALGGGPRILAALDAWYLNAAAAVDVARWPLRPLYRLDERRVRRFEGVALRPYDAVVTVSEGDAQALRALEPSLVVEVIPNGVDADEFAPDPAVARESGHVVFTGAMHWPPNVAAARFLAERVQPRVRAAHPDAQLSIVGRRPHRELAALGGLPGVRVTGEVPDVRPWLHRAAVYACPMVSGTGIKNKLLEALACATPAVATPLACQGLDVTGGEELLVAPADERFADAVIGLLNDAALRDRLGAAGRSYVVEHHAWAAVADRYERLYERISARPATPA
jgi:polysaccharide biosynthesis protein PslH